MNWIDEKATYLCELVANTLVLQEKEVLTKHKTDIAVGIIAEKIHTALEEAHTKGKQEALSSVPVGFVRQWINEDLLKPGHKLVTDEDIQSFINVALKDNK